MLSLTHGHTRKYYQTLKENPKFDWVAVHAETEQVKEIFLKGIMIFPVIWMNRKCMLPILKSKQWSWPRQTVNISGNSENAPGEVFISSA